MSNHRSEVTAALSVALALAAGLALACGASPNGGVESATALAASNPCAAKTSNPCNPCGANPCNPCGSNPCNPCAGKTNPCGANPCNPCGGARVDPSRFQQPGGVTLASGPPAELLAQGQQLWNDRSLGNSGLACSTCHFQKYAQMQPGFAEPYPHAVRMVQEQSGVEQVNAAEMVQFCMLQPMQAEPLAWTSRELAALTAWVKHIQPGYRPVGGAATHPCNPDPP